MQNYSILSSIVPSIVPSILLVMWKVFDDLFNKDAKTLDAKSADEIKGVVEKSVRDVFCARILTPGELAKLQDGDVVWEQIAVPVDPSESVYPLVKYKGYISNYKHYIVYPEELDAADYGTSWRVWSLKPTDEQLATPWSPMGSFEPYEDG